MIRLKILLICAATIWSCSTDTEQEINCSTLQIVLKNTINPTTCSPADGEVSVFAIGGTPPYSFRINNGRFQSDSLFKNLQGGSYKIEVVDVQECANTLEAMLSNFNSNLGAAFVVTPDTNCLTGNGGAEFIPSGGNPPYRLRFQNTLIENNLTLTDLRSGLHQVAIVDAESCEFVIALTIPRQNTGTSWSVDIKPIIDTRCAKPVCHVAGTGRSDLTKFINVKQLANEIRTRTQNRSMPFDEPMPSSQIQLIACWVDDGALDN